MDSKGDSSLRFVPEMLVDYINKFSKSDLEPASFFIHGVCLLVDISGFTKLSGDYCALGKSGVDDLQLATNGFMGKLVEIVYTFGGDIIKFAGDAIICVFSADFITSVSSKDLLRRSTCGFESFMIDLDAFMNRENSHIPVLSSTKSSRISAEVILRVMHCARVLREVQTDKLTVHVAMSCGEMCFGILGGFENRWECLISGPCIHQLSDCLDDAPSKHAVISKECAEVLKNASSVTNVPFLEGRPEERADGAIVNKISTNAGMYEFEILPLESGNYRIIDVQCGNNIDALANAISKASVKTKLNEHAHLKLIRQFVPVPVAEELESAANLNYMAEIREVTTMFMKWDSYDADGKHRDLLDLQACFYQAQRILQSTGAYLRQFLVDDKGCVLIGCWGMPHLSYLDNAFRAVSSAALIRHELEKLSMNCSFGITTGDVYCGTVGSALRMEYAAIGSCVNMSARLMGKANGGILIDDATFARLPSSVLRVFKALAPIKVKGRDGLLQVYNYTGSGAIGAPEKAVDDHEISLVCKSTLNTLLQRLAPSSASNAITQNEFSERRRLTWLPRIYRAAEPTPVQNTTLPVVLIQGREGSGRTTVITWLKSQALDYKLTTCCVRLSKKDSSIEYGMWKKIFVQLMPKDLFLNNTVQRQHVLHLLRKAYSGNTKMVRTHGFPVLRAALGITCEFEDVVKPLDKNDSSMFNSVHSLISHKSYKTKPAVSSNSRIVQFADCLVKVFSYLLNSQTFLVVVENVELADEDSLQLLVDLTKVATRSAIVCTALADTDTQEILSDKRHATKILHSNAFNSSPWSKQFKNIVMQLPTSTSIMLENYTPDEIDKMLAVALGMRVVPPEISQLVQDFSGGSYFWVREILQFIKEHGPDLFMSAVGENEKDESSDKTHDLTIRAPKQRRSNSTLSPTALGNGGGITKTPSARSMARTPSFKNSSARRAGASPHQQQLDKLVLCRFGNLSPEIQRILRTASIIGNIFTHDVLLGVLPDHLKGRLMECVTTLLQQRWIYEDTEIQNMFHFAHFHSHGIIYQLTPSSERNNLHQMIADYISVHCKEDPNQYALLCYHLVHCDTDQALQYAVKAVAVMLDTTDIFDFDDCLDLLRGLRDCCKTPFDVAVLQALLNQARDTIESLDVSPAAHLDSPEGRWLRYFACFSSTSHSPVSVVPSSKLAELSTCSSSDRSKNYPVMSDEEEEVEKGGREEHRDINYEQRTKRLLLSQISRFRNALCEKFVDLSEEQNTKYVPKEWQRMYLRL